MGSNVKGEVLVTLECQTSSHAWSSFFLIHNLCNFWVVEGILMIVMNIIAMDTIDLVYLISLHVALKGTLIILTIVE
jgi:hypothetical protein